MPHDDDRYQNHDHGDRPGRHGRGPQADRWRNAEDGRQSQQFQERGGRQLGDSGRHSDRGQQGGHEGDRDHRAYRGGGQGEHGGPARSGAYDGRPDNDLDERSGREHRHPDYGSRSADDREAQRSESWSERANPNRHAYGEHGDRPEGPGSRRQDTGHGGGRDYRHSDPEYHQWREAQIRSLDDDYDAWRQERYRKFSDEFGSWRSSRQGSPAGEAASGTGADGQGAVPQADGSGTSSGGGSTATSTGNGAPAAAGSAASADGGTGSKGTN